MVFAISLVRLMITQRIAYGHFNAKPSSVWPEKSNDLVANFSRSVRRNSVVKSGSHLDEHGLSNLCHRNAIYISVGCVLFRVSLLAFVNRLNCDLH